TVVAADQDHVGLGLRHAGRDRSDPDFGDQLHAYPRAIVGILEVVDQLREILDRIDIVVWRRRDEPDPGRRVTNLRDEIIDLLSGQLTTLAGLGALRHLDLEFVGVDQVVTGHAEARRCDLLDRAAPPVAVGIGNETRRVLAPLAGVALATDSVHRDGQVL